MAAVLYSIACENLVGFGAMHRLGSPDARAAVLRHVTSHSLRTRVALRNGTTGQFDLVVDGEVLLTRGGSWLTRKLGAGYPDFEEAVAELKKRVG